MNPSKIYPEKEHNNEDENEQHIIEIKTTEKTQPIEEKQQHDDSQSDSDVTYFSDRMIICGILGSLLMVCWNLAMLALFLPLAAKDLKLWNDDPKAADKASAVVGVVTLYLCFLGGMVCTCYLGTCIGSYVDRRRRPKKVEHPWIFPAAVYSIFCLILVWWKVNPIFTAAGHGK